MVYNHTMDQVSQYVDRERRRYGYSTMDYIDDRPTRRKRRMISRDALSTSSPSFPRGGRPHVTLLADIGKKCKKNGQQNQELQTMAEERGDFFRKESAQKIKCSQNSQRSIRSYGSVVTQSSQSDNYSESTSFVSSETSSDSKRHDGSGSKMVDTIATVIQKALLKKADIENRQAAFSRLIKNSHSHYTNNALRVDIPRKIEEPVQSRVSDSYETSSDDLSYTFSRPRFRARKSKFSSNRRDTPSPLPRKLYTDVTVTLKKPSFVFDHPEATYLLTKIPKTNVEESRDVESSTSTAEDSNRRKDDLTYKVTPRQPPKDHLTVPLEDPFHETKKSLDVQITNREMNKSWAADVQAIYAAINRITPPSTCQQSRRSKRHNRSWSPQREPGDHGIVSIVRPKLPTESAIFSEQASGQDQNDRGTSPLPQPSVIHRGVGYTIENRGTSPFPRVPSFDKEILVQEPRESWKDLETKKIDSTMKTIAKLSEIHPPVENSTYAAMDQNNRRRKHDHSMYRDSPPPKVLKDRGLVSCLDKNYPANLTSTNMDPFELDSEWSGHSIVISEFMNTSQSNPNPLESNELLESPFSFGVLGTGYTIPKMNFNSSVKEAVKRNVEEDKKLLQLKPPHGSQNTTALYHSLVEFDSPRKRNHTNSDVCQEKRGETQKISPTLNSNEPMKKCTSGKHNIKPDKPTSPKGKMLIRSSWHLPQIKSKRGGNIENVASWIAPQKNSVAPEPDEDTRSISKIRV